MAGDQKLHSGEWYDMVRILKKWDCGGCHIRVSISIFYLLYRMSGRVWGGVVIFGILIPVGSVGVVSKQHKYAPVVNGI